VRLWPTLGGFGLGRAPQKPRTVAAMYSSPVTSGSAVRCRGPAQRANKRAVMPVAAPGLLRIPPWLSHTRMLVESLPTTVVPVVRRPSRALSPVTSRAPDHHAGDGDPPGSAKGPPLRGRLALALALCG